MDNQINPNTKIQIIDSRTGNAVKTYKYSQIKAARRFCDKMDAQYGAVRYIVKYFWEEILK